MTYSALRLMPNHILVRVHLACTLHAHVLPAPFWAFSDVHAMAALANE